MLRTLATSRIALRAAAAAPAAARMNSADAFKKRERALENAYFSQKDHELLLKLKEKAAASRLAGEDMPAEAHALAGGPAEVEVDFHDQPVDMHDLMTLRKEMLERIQALEEIIGTLKYRQTKLLMKTAKY